MKNVFKVCGIIAFAAAIAFGAASCDNGGDGGGDGWLKLLDYPELEPEDIAGTAADTDGGSPPPANADQFEEFVAPATVYYTMKDEFMADLVMSDSVYNAIENGLNSGGPATVDLGETVSASEYRDSGIAGFGGTLTARVLPGTQIIEMELDLAYMCDSAGDTTPDWQDSFDEPNPKPNYWMKARAKYHAAARRSSTRTSMRVETTGAATYLGSFNLPEQSGKFRFSMARAEAEVWTAQYPDGRLDGTPLMKASVIFYDNDWNQLYEHVYTRAEMEAYSDLVDSLRPDSD